MSWFEALAIFAAGIGAGTINTIVGSGTLITFPTLLFFGYPPLAANISNNVGLVAGGATGSWAYRHEMRGGGGTIRTLLPLSLAGSVVGASLLLVLPQKVFAAVVPVLILASIVLVLSGPRLQARAAARASARAGAGAVSAGEPEGMPLRTSPALLLGVFAAGIYGGYFGAAQGVLLMGIFSALTTEGLQRLNGYKNVLSTGVNFVAAVFFLVFARAQVSWAAAGLIAVGAILGGLLGARVGRSLRPAVLRGVIVTVGVAAVLRMVLAS